MVIQIRPHYRSSQSASLMVELLVAIALLTGALMPIAFSIASERRLARTLYERGVAMEIVDGQLEILAAGEWKSLGPGRHLLHPKSRALANLPRGEFFAQIESSKLRVEWLSASNPRHASIVREVVIKSQPPTRKDEK